jgi:hypothetical protein
MNAITASVTICDWLFSHSVTFSRFIQAAACIYFMTLMAN